MILFYNIFNIISAKSLLNKHTIVRITSSYIFVMKVNTFYNNYKIIICYVFVNINLFNHCDTLKLHLTIFHCFVKFTKLIMITTHKNRSCGGVARAELWKVYLHACYAYLVINANSSSVAWQGDRFEISNRIVRSMMFECKRVIFLIILKLLGFIWIYYDFTGSLMIL